MILNLVLAVVLAHAATTAPVKTTSASRDTITLGGGCFWCTEAVFVELKGVESVTSGYSGGKVPHPSYEMVCTGTTGHAESSQIVYDPSVLPTKDLLSIFFTVHDPTTLNRQGNDVGTQYRSVIFYRNERQKTTAQQVIKEITAKKVWPGKIVTEVTPFKAFYPAESYHQDYFARNPDQAYCQVVIAPKVAKLRAHYLSRLKNP